MAQWITASACRAENLEIDSGSLKPTNKKLVFTAVALEIFLSRGGGLKFVLPYQRLGGFAPQTPLFGIATDVVHTMHITSVKITWRQLGELKLSSS